MLKEVVPFIASAKLPPDIYSLDSNAHARKERKVQSHLGILKDGSLFTRSCAMTLMSFTGLYLRYPSDADKHLLARQTALSRNQVSNWFINARVRLWKPMVEEMYQQETKEEGDNNNNTEKERNPNNNNNNNAQTSMSSITAVPTTTKTTPTDKRSQINATENDPSLIAINGAQCFSKNQAKQCNPTTTTITNTNNTATEVAPPVSQPFTTTHDSNIHQSIAGVEDMCHSGSVIATDYGTTTPNIGSTLIRSGTSAGDVSLTLGLRHVGNMPENTSSFSVKDFRGC